MYLIKLARFVEFEEQKTITKKIRKISKAKTIEQNKRILLQSSLNQKQLNKLKTIQGINSIQKIIKEKTTQNLKELIEFIKKNAKLIETKIELQKGLPFHKQAILQRLKKQKLTLIQGNKEIIEIKQFQNKIITRIMQNIELKEKPLNPINQKQLKKTIKEIIFILVEPKTKNEVADFMRLTEIFKTKLVLIDSTNHSKQLIKEASERIKSIKSKKILVKINNSFEKTIKGYYTIGFSLWGKQTEQELINLKHEKIALVFGNEKKGLPLHVRQKLETIIRLGPKTSQPMRSSQALAYALALINLNTIK